MTHRPVRHPSEFVLGPYGLLDPRFLEPPAVQVLPGALSHLNIRYARPPGWRPLLADLHLPAQGAGPFPVVVYCHGGSFLVGDKDMEPGPWRTLPGQGIAVLSIDYRPAGEVSHPEPIEDVLAAIRWVRSQAGRFDLDPTRLAGWGSSAGAYLIGRAAFADGGPVGRPIGEAGGLSAELSCAVLHYPATDFSTALDDAVEPTPESQHATEDVISRYFGFPMFAQPEILSTSSIAHAAAAARHRPPVLLQHGDADRRSGPRQSERLHAALIELGSVCELDIIPGEDHATAAFASPRVVDTAVNFLRRCWATEPVRAS